MSDQPESTNTYHFRASATHDETHQTDGIVCYWGTFAEAVEWVAGWPNAIEVKIERRPFPSE